MSQTNRLQFMLKDLWLKHAIIVDSGLSYSSHDAVCISNDFVKQPDLHFISRTCTARKHQQSFAGHRPYSFFVRPSCPLADNKLPLGENPAIMIRATKWPKRRPVSVHMSCLPPCLTEASTSRKSGHVKREPSYLACCRYASAIFPGEDVVPRDGSRHLINVKQDKSTSTPEGSMKNLRKQVMVLSHRFLSALQKLVIKESHVSRS